MPITAADIPNLFVSVLLVKGRTKVDGPPGAEDSSDPGKPSFRLGYAKLTVDDASKRLSVSVKANKDEFRPAGTAKVDLLVKDARGVPASSEVTLWAVDYGVLSLTGYRTPDVLGSVYVHKALQVMNTDSRQRIVSRRVLTPKGSGDGGGGGAESGVSQLRKDFRVLAFWLGSVTTDKNGHASTDVKLPESLTTYRIMAVGGDKESRFGSGESEIRINKPVVLKAAFPRFLARGDKAFFGSVVTSQLKDAGTAIVTMRSLDPGVLEITGDPKRLVQVAGGGSTEVRFDVVARATGRARVQVSVRLGNETDAFEDAIPVEVLATPRIGGRVRRGGAGREADVRDADRQSCPASAACTSRWRRRRSSASAKARATSSNTRTAASSSARRDRSSSRSRRIWAMRSSCPASTRKTCRRGRRRRCASWRSSSARRAVSRSGPASA